MVPVSEMSLFCRSRVCRPVHSARWAMDSTLSSLLLVQMRVFSMGQQARLLSLLILLLLMFRVSRLLISSRPETSCKSLFWTNLERKGRSGKS